MFYTGDRMVVTESIGISYIKEEGIDEKDHNYRKWGGWDFGG